MIGKIKKILYAIHHTPSANGGFSLLEALLAASLFSLIVMGFVGTLIFGQESTALSGKRARAAQLASEGVEAARNLRDNDFTNLTTGTHGLAIASNQWEFSGTEDVTDIFTRQIVVGDVDATTKIVTSTVSWSPTAQRGGTVSMVTRLTDWSRIVADDISIRATEYFVDVGTLTGTTYDLTLDQDLEDNYFVIVQGSDGDGSGNNNRGPDENYLTLTGDPNGTGDLIASGGTDVLSFTRGNAVNSWVGVITVVECLQDCVNSGFTLHDVQVVTHSGIDVSGLDTSATQWSDIDQVVLMGGFNGSGCQTSDTNVGNTKVCHARIWPSGDDVINWTRDATGANLSTAESTVMVLEWGNEWTIQRVNVTGSNGGNGADATGEYDTGALTSSITRDNTWVWGTGHTNDQGIGDAAEGTLITLGNGVDENVTESTVAVGQEYSDDRDFEVYALTHSDLLVDYAFKTDGNSGDLTYDAAVTPATNSMSRMAIVYNGQNGTGIAYPRSMFSARYTTNDTIRMERRRSGQAWPAWIQGIDFVAIEPTPDVTAPGVVSNLVASNPSESSIDLAWTAPGDDGSSGTATTYDVRYSTGVINDGNWAAAAQATGEPSPSVAGSSESMTVSGLSSATTHYFAVKTSDEVPNTSGISNVPSLATLSDISTCVAYCQSQAYSGGTCRQNQVQCNNNGETYESGGDVYCTGGPSVDTCCCAP